MNDAGPSFGSVVACLKIPIRTLGRGFELGALGEPGSHAIALSMGRHVGPLQSVSSRLKYYLLST